MNLASRLKLAKQRAEAIVTEMGIVAPSIDPFAIAAEHGIEVQAKPAEVEGVSGMLLRHGDSFGILYSTNVASIGFQRFSVAHELGHYFLDGHCDQLLSAGLHVSRAGQGSPDPFEQEADAFASGLLMPRTLLRPLLARRELCLDLLTDIADAFKTSLSATGLRIAELSHNPMALVVSRAGTIEYCQMSESMKPHARRGWLKRGDRLPPGSVSALLAADGDAVLRAGRREADVDIADWYDCEGRVQGREEAIGLGGYGRVLTLLTCASADEPEDDDPEAEQRDLVDRWTPRFGR